MSSKKLIYSGLTNEQRRAIKNAVHDDHSRLIDSHPAKNPGKAKVHTIVEKPGWQKKNGTNKKKDPTQLTVRHYSHRTIGARQHLVTKNCI